MTSSIIRHVISSLCIALVILGFAVNLSFAAPLVGIGPKDITDKLNQDPTKVIDTSSIKGNPITNGTDALVSSNVKSPSKIQGIFTVMNGSYSTVLSETMQKVQNITNRALGFLALFSVIYLVYHGFILLMKFDDDKAQSEALSSIKTIAWVIGGIGLTWFIVSTAFYVVGLLGSDNASSSPTKFDNGPNGGGYTFPK